MSDAHGKAAGPDGPDGPDGPCAPARPDAAPDRGDVLPLEAVLAGVDGIDMQAAMLHVGGRVALLERMLRKFVAHYGGSAFSLAGPTHPDQLPALCKQCHALRGACAAIGATALAEALQRLESAAMAPPGRLDELAAATARVREDLQRLMAGLTRALHR